MSLLVPKPTIVFPSHDAYHSSSSSLSSTPPSTLSVLRKVPRSSPFRQRFNSKMEKLAVSAEISSVTPGAAVSGFDLDSFGEVTIFSASDGESVMFKDLLDTKEGITVVALLRHFGCICCWELASILRDNKPKFDSAGVKLIAVGVGPPDKARILADRLSFPLDCLYADPERKAYDVLGLYYGLGRTFFNPASKKVFSRLGSYREILKNYTIKATSIDSGSVLQQGGMFVFKGNQLMYARKDEGTGDHAPLDDILDICCKDQVAAPVS